MLMSAHRKKAWSPSAAASVNALSSALSFLIFLITSLWPGIFIVETRNVYKEFSVAMPDWNSCSHVSCWLIQFTQCFSFHSSCQDAQFILGQNCNASLSTHPTSLCNELSFSFFLQQITWLSPNHAQFFAARCSVCRRLGRFGNLRLLQCHCVGIQPRNLVEFFLPRSYVGGDESELVHVPFLRLRFFPSCFFSERILHMFLLSSSEKLFFLVCRYLPSGSDSPIFFVLQSLFLNFWYWHEATLERVEEEERWSELLRPTFLLHRSPLVCCELDRSCNRLVRDCFSHSRKHPQVVSFFNLWEVVPIKSVKQLLRLLRVELLPAVETLVIASCSHSNPCNDVIAELGSVADFQTLLPAARYWLGFFLIAPLVKGSLKRLFFLIFHLLPLPTAADTLAEFAQTMPSPVQSSLFALFIISSRSWLPMIILTSSTDLIACVWTTWICDSASMFLLSKISLWASSSLCLVSLISSACLALSVASKILHTLRWFCFFQHCSRCFFFLQSCKEAFLLLVYILFLFCLRSQNHHFASYLNGVGCLSSCAFQKGSFVASLPLFLTITLATFTSQSSVSSRHVRSLDFELILEARQPRNWRLAVVLDKFCLHPSSSFPVGTLILNVIPSCINWIPLFSVSFLASSRTCCLVNSLPSACLANGIHLSFFLSSLLLSSSYPQVMNIIPSPPDAFLNFSVVFPAVVKSSLICLAPLSFLHTSSRS